MVVLIVITLGTALYLYSIKCLKAPISPSIRSGLTACRIIFLLALLYLFTLPYIREILNISTPSTLYIVLDDSLSMSYPADPPTMTGQEGPSRWDETINQLKNKGLIDSWEKKGFELRYSLLSDISSEYASSKPFGLSQFPISATPSYPYSDIGSVVSSFAESISPDITSKLLLFTDGRWNLGQNPISSSSLLTAATRQIHPQVYTFGIGTASPIQDIIVDSIQAPSSARSGQPIELRAHIIIRGGDPSAIYKTRMTVQNRSGDMIVENQQDISPEPDISDLNLSFDIPDLEKGYYILSVAVDPMPGEWITSNNRQIKGIKIRDAQDKVLLITSAPDWEFKYLKRTLEDQKALSVNAFLHHPNGLSALGDRSWIDRRSDAAPTEDTPKYKHLTELQDQLNQWPVIILHNFAFSIDHIEFINQLRQYVEEGGGLIFIPGPNNAGMPPQVLQDAAPAPVARAFTPKMRAALAKIGLDSDAPFAELIQNNPQLDLPPLSGYVTARPQSDSAKLLLMGEAAMNEQVQLVTLHRYGLGRIVILSSRSFWRWNLLTGKDLLTPFWMTVLFQSCPRLEEQSGEVQIDGYLFNSFDSVRISYRSANQIGAATPSSGIGINVRGPSRKETIWLTPSGDAPGVYETRYTPVEPGAYQAATFTENASAEFRVENTAAELRDLRQNIADLRTLSELTGGEYANLPAWKTMADRIPYESKIIREERSRFIGEKWWILTLLIAFLGLEWFLRWMKGLP